MKYLKKINLNESKYEDILDILDILTDLKDDNMVEESKFIMIHINNKLELEVSMVRNHFKTENNIESLQQTSKLLNEISHALIRISQISDISFSFSGDNLSIFFDYNKNVKKFLSKVNEGKYEINNIRDYLDEPLRLELFRLPNDIRDEVDQSSSFIINNDLSCRFITHVSSWNKIGRVNNDPKLQEAIVKEVSQYGFEFVKKWHDESWGLEPYGQVLWFEFYIKSVI